MPEETIGCGKPTGGVVGEKPPKQAKQETSAAEEKEEKMSILIGRKAPDFQAPAFHQGKFTSVKLSDYLGKWVVLCFYPGDFTFV